MSKNGQKKNEGATISLSVYDRFILKDRVILEGIGSFEESLICMDLRDRIDFTEEEVKKLNFREEGGGLKWNNIPEIEMAFSAQELAITKMGFRLLRGEKIPKEPQYFLLLGKFLSKEERGEILNDIRAKKERQKEKV